MTFPDLGAHPALARALAERGYTTPTAVQAAVLDPALRGRDLLVSSRTGSGKTVAFGLVLAEALLGEAPSFPQGGDRAPGALVVAPTRELALQVSEELTWLLAAAGGRVTSCVGGVDPRREARALSAGAHVVVGTPGRLLDHHRRRSLVLERLKAVVLDEADEMLDMGFKEELEAILAAAPPERRTILFSATLPRPIVELAKRYTREPARVAASVEEAHEDISFRAHLVSPGEREHALVNVLRAEAPDRALVFRSTREAAHHTAAGLAERGFAAVGLSGELTQAERTRALVALRDGRARVLVATDVAARGLDLPGLDLVVHADPPRDAAALQHRSGRTGRAGRKGLAVLLAAPNERWRLAALLKQIGAAVEWAKVPSAESIRAADDTRLAERVDALAVDAAPEERAAAERLLEGRDPVLVAAALVRAERERLPSPEDLPETARAAREAPAQKGVRKARGGPPADTIWFRVSLGRERQADPKWILPMLCRRGGVTRDEIGKIVVGDRETRFEVARAAADKFRDTARKPDPRAPGVRIEPLAGGAAATPARRYAPAEPAPAPSSTPPSAPTPPPAPKAPAAARAHATAKAPAAAKTPGPREGDGHAERRGTGTERRKPRTRPA